MKTRTKFPLFLLVWIACAAFCGGPLARAEETSGLSQMDAAVAPLLEGYPYSASEKTRAQFLQKRLGEFIHSAKYAPLREQYMQAVQGYFSGVFPEDFKIMLQNLSRANRKVPLLATRLLLPTQFRADFAVESEIKSSGRDINAAKWTALLDQRIAKAKLEAGQFIRMNPLRRKEYISKTLEETEKALVENRQALEERFGDKAHLIAREQGEFIKQLKADPSFVALSEYIVYDRLTREPYPDQLRSGSADVVLSVLDQIKSDPQSALEAHGQMSPEVASLFKASFPESHRLKQDKELFPPARTQTARGKMVNLARTDNDTVFISPERALHTIWKGFCYSECIRTSPARFLTAALGGSFFQFIERGGRNKGWVHIVPVRNVLNGDERGSVDFGSSTFNDRVYWMSPEGKRVQVTVFDKWLAQVSKDFMKPSAPGSSRWVVGQSKSGDNAGALGTVRSSLAYVAGEAWHQGKDVVPVDPLYRQIARVNGWLSGNGYGYSEKRMVFDATLSSAGTLTELENFSLGKVPNREKLAKTLNAMRSPREAETYLHQLQIGGISDAQVAEALAFAAHNASEDKARVLALGLLPQLKADPAFIRGALIESTFSPSKEIQIAASIALLTLDHAQGQQSGPSVVADAAKLLQEDGIKQVLNPESMARLFEALSAHSVLPAPLRQSLLAYVQNRPPNFISRKWHLAALRLLAKDNPEAPELLALLTKLAASRSAEARRSALETIAGLALPEQTKRSIFETALKDSSTQIRRLAAVELLKNDSAHSEAMDLMLKTLERNHPDFWIRAEAVRALRPFEASHPRVAAALLKAAHDVNPAVSKVARAGKEEETLPKPAPPSRWEKSRAYRAACWASWRWLERRP